MNPGKYFSLIGLFVNGGELYAEVRGYVKHIVDQGVLNQLKDGQRCNRTKEQCDDGSEKRFLEYWGGDTQLLERSRQWSESDLDHRTMPWVLRARIEDNERFQQELPKIRARFRDFTTHVYEHSPANSE